MTSSYHLCVECFSQLSFEFVSSALLVNFTEISVVRRTEISVMKCTTEISVRLTTEISVKLTSKADETNFRGIKTQENFADIFNRGGLFFVVPSLKRL